LTAFPARRHVAALLLVFGLVGCQSELPPEAFADGRPEMRPEAFFAGATESTGVLEDRGGAPTQRFMVHGRGAPLPEGGIRLEQDVAFAHEAARTRMWVLRRLDEHRYGGTLSDASGPVTGEAYGDLFHLRYKMQSPFGGEMEQWMYLQSDGRTVMNEATVRVFGLVAAHLSERITHAGANPPN
jgi:hypothetical protein